MPDNRADATAQLLVYAIAPGAAFEGQLLGALERVEAGGGLRIIEVMFVARDHEGELTAIALKGAAGGGLTEPLLEFRLDPAARRRATKRALDGRSGVPPETLADLGDTLEPGGALAAVLVEHVWARALHDAVGRTRGTPLVAEFVHETTLAELAPTLLSASRAAGASPT